MSICEIRIPTYKRPHLLKRALTSVINQTHKNWLAIVFDDSPEQEAKAIVEAFNHNRIIYRPHKTNLGRAKNIDYAFLSTSLLGSSYAFVLEDDNYLLPDFISENIKSLEKNKVNIVLRNQEIRIEKNGVSIPTGRTTRGRWFKQGIYSPIEIYARLFFCEGISNGGLFWNTDKIQSDLQVGSQVKNSWHQELFRTLQIKEPVYFEAAPLCVFTEFDINKRPHESFNIHRILKQSPQHNRLTQSVLIHLVNKYGDSIVQQAQEIALKAKAEILLERQLINAFYFNYGFSKTSKLEFTRLLVKSFLRYILYQENLKDMFSAF